MFTGLIQQVGTLARRETVAGGLRLVIAGAPWNPPLTRGESMAVNGACLTLAHIPVSYTHLTLPTNREV